MRESKPNWLRIIRRTVKEINGSELDYLIKESGELKNILVPLSKNHGNKLNSPFLLLSFYFCLDRYFCLLPFVFYL